MKTKYLTLFILGMICLAGCGGVTPVPPAETSTPVFTSTATVYPTSAYALTRTVFESLMKNVCPTTTPYPTQSGQSNSLTDNEVSREFAGNYSRGDFFGSDVLNLNCDGTFYEISYTDTGSQFINQGYFEAQNGELVLKSMGNNEVFTTIYLPVRWEQRKYLLVKEYDIPRFCKASAGQDEYYQEPRNEESFIGLIYLRIGDEKIEVTGLPVLPNSKEICN